VTKREEDIPKDEVQIYDFDSDGKVVEIERDSSNAGIVDETTEVMKQSTY
jgi:hypothetical protein